MESTCLRQVECTALSRCFTKLTVDMALTPFFRSAEVALVAMAERDRSEEAGELAKALLAEPREEAPSSGKAAGRRGVRGRRHRAGAQLRVAQRPDAAKLR